MCEACGPANGQRDTISPESMEAIHDFNRREAARRGISLDDYLLANVTVSRANRTRSWLSRMKINLQLLRHWL